MQHGDRVHIPPLRMQLSDNQPPSEMHAACSWPQGSPFEANPLLLVPHQVGTLSFSNLSIAIASRTQDLSLLGVYQEVNSLSAPLDGSLSVYPIPDVVPVRAGPDVLRLSLGSNRHFLSVRRSLAVNYRHHYRLKTRSDCDVIHPELTAEYRSGRLGLPVDLRT